MTITRKIHLTRKVAPCPHCGEKSKRHSIGRRRLNEIGITGPTVLEVTYSKHYCERCKKHFSQRLDYLAPPTGRYTHRVRNIAVPLIIRKMLTYEDASIRMLRKYHVNVPPSTLNDWVVSG